MEEKEIRESHMLFCSVKQSRILTIFRNTQKREDAKLEISYILPTF